MKHSIVIGFVVLLTCSSCFKSTNSNVLDSDDFETAPERVEALKNEIKSESDFNVDLVDIEHILLGELEEKIIRCNAMLVGSPTINQNTLLPIYKMFALLNPIRDKGKFAATFGSFGWSGEAVKVIESHLKLMKLNIVQDGFAVKFFPNNDKNNEIVEFGKKFVEKVKEG